MMPRDIDFSIAFVSFFLILCVAVVQADPGEHGFQTGHIPACRTVSGTAPYKCAMLQLRNEFDTQEMAGIYVHYYAML